MKLNGFQKICLIFFIGLVAFWSYITLSNLTAGTLNYLYSFLFGLIPLVGGAIAMARSRIWGNSAMGKAVFFTGLGLFLWGVGETIWSYYNFVLNVPAPYPSLADLFFAPSIFFYGLGAFYLAKVTGAKYGLRSPIAKVFLIVAPIVVFVVSYHFLVTVARGGVLIPEEETLLKAILDIAYPLGDFLSLTIAIMVSSLSFKYFGGIYKMDIFSILLGLGVMFVADCVFSYTTTVGTYYNANFGDLLLTTGLFLITFGILGFCNKLKLA